MTRRWLMLAVIVVGSGCCCQQAEDPDVVPKPPSTLGAEYDVYEAIIRHHIQHFAAGDGLKPEVYYVAIQLRDDDDKTDPPAAFLQRFADLKVSVRAASVQMRVDDPRPAADIWLGPVEWQGTNDVRMMGRVYEAWVTQKCGTPWPMLASRKDGKWAMVIR